MKKYSRKYESITDNDSGFSLMEVVVAAGIIIVIVLAFTIFMLSFAKKQNTLKSNMEATKVLQTELEKTNAIPWKDLMVRPGSNPDAECALGGTRGTSSQAISTTPETVTTPEGLRVQIVRNVTWSDGSTQVTCAGTKDKDELKKVTVTVNWYDGQTTKAGDTTTGEDNTLMNKTKSLSTYRSFYTE